jgi:hypothetical protein
MLYQLIKAFKEYDFARQQRYGRAYLNLCAYVQSSKTQGNAVEEKDHNEYACVTSLLQL